MDVSPPRWSRRRLLQGAFATTALVGLGGVALALQKTRELAGTPPLAVLDASEYAVLVALAERLCPDLGAGAPGATKVGVAAYIDAMLAASDDETKKAVKGALALFESALGGALVGERVRPFTALSAEQQADSLRAFRDSSLGVRRTLFRALAGAVWAVYWGNPSTWKRIGYDGPPNVAALRASYADNLVDLNALRATPLQSGT